MANQKNFVSNISELSVYNTKYTVSRIIDAPTVNPLLEMEVPADFLDFDENHTVEMHVYSIADNSLVYSEIISNTFLLNSPIKVQKFIYKTGSRNLLYIDFSTLGEIFPPRGKYRVCFNFFVNELNTSANSRGLVITKISPSRREVEVKYSTIDSSSRLAMDKFITPSIGAETTMDMLKQIFNQSGSEELRLNMFTSSINEERIANVLGPSASQNLTTYAFDLDRPAQFDTDDNTSNLGVYTIAQNVLDRAYVIASASMVLAINTHGSRSFTFEMLTSSVSYAISRSYEQFRANSVNTGTKYRFDLI